MKRLLSLFLIIAMLTLSLSSCSSGPLSKYKEDKSTGIKDTYYVAMAIEGHGVIIVELYHDKAPKTVENFVSLAREGFYDGLTFHRVIDNFMIQGGDPLANGRGGSDTNIPGEFLANGYFDNDISHLRGVISMARSDGPDSASSQFFICNADATSLDGSYAAFGRVVEGMDTVDSITEGTVKFAGYNGTIANKANQAVISEMKVIEYTKGK